MWTILLLVLILLAIGQQTAENKDHHESLMRLEEDRLEQARIARQAQEAASDDKDDKKSDYYDSGRYM